MFPRNLTEFYVGREESKLPRKIMNSHNAVISLFNMFVLKVNQWQRLTPSFYKKFIAFTPRKQANRGFVAQLFDQNITAESGRTRNISQFCLAL